MMKRLLPAFFLLAVLLPLASGCAAWNAGSDLAAGKKVVVGISALKDKKAPEKTIYAIFPGDEAVAADDLQFREFAACVERALAMKGFRPAREGEKPELAIFLSYGISKPQRVFSSRPVYGKTGDTVTGYTVSTYREGDFARTDIHAKTKSEYGVVGKKTVSTAIYERWITIDAADGAVLADTGRRSPVWKVELLSEGSTGDLREIFPAMIAAGEPYFATDTGKRITREIRMKSSAIKAINGD